MFETLLWWWPRHTNGHSAAKYTEESPPGLCLDSRARCQKTRGYPWPLCLPYCIAMSTWGFSRSSSERTRLVSPSASLSWCGDCYTMSQRIYSSSGVVPGSTPWVSPAFPVRSCYSNTVLWAALICKQKKHTFQGHLAWAPRYLKQQDGSLMFLSSFSVSFSFTLPQAQGKV